MKKHILLFVLFATITSICFAQTSIRKIDTTVNFVIHFRFDRSVVDSGYMNNASVLKSMHALLDQEEVVSSLDSILIVTTSSPEGVIEYNRQLSKTRARNLKGYLAWKHSNISKESIKTKYIDEDWVGLRELIANDKNVPLGDKAISIIDTDVNSGTKEWRLRQLGSGATWRYIEKNFLRHLRSGASCIVFYRTIEVTQPEEPKEEIIEQTPESEKEEVVLEPIEPIIEEKEWIKKPLFAVKSNLLYDLGTALNVELEVPIGKRWSVSGECLFPWWQSNNANWTMQLLSGHGAVKYWFGDRDRWDVLTGWSMGLYGGAGKYDLQLFNVKGAQGSFFDAGLQVGFAHKIGRVLRMEYSLGLGYLQTDYKEYDKVRDTNYGDIKVFRYPWETHRRNWIGPTSAKVSLVWLLHYKTIKK